MLAKLQFIGTTTGNFTNNKLYAVIAWGNISPGPITISPNTGTATAILLDDNGGLWGIDVGHNANWQISSVTYEDCSIQNA